MPQSLNEFEEVLSSAIRAIPLSDRVRSGAFLPIIPDRTKWESYLESAKADWKMWRGDLMQYPACLFLLYVGLAFYEYDENVFWPQFAASLKIDPLPANQQQEINSAFSKSTKLFGLELKSRDKGIDYVGSAVSYIGIPLSLWDGLLEVCHWALWRHDWKVLPDLEWHKSVEKLAGSRQRLKRFLIHNRDSATQIVQEMLDAREILSKDMTLSVKNIAQASILRFEYFDEIPETAEFLRQQNPESLFQDRARLVLDDRNRKICLLLPGVDNQRLPAIWSIGRHLQPASQSPDEMVIDAEAFGDAVILSLTAGNNIETQRLRGVAPWALFDMTNGGGIINAHRDELPLKSYILLSRDKLEIHREGFDEDENPVNEPYFLSDGSVCFVTRLWPTGKYAEIRVNEASGTNRIIRFKTRNRIEASFVMGWGYKSAYFTRMMDKRIKTDHLPIPYVVVPNGYFRNNDAVLDQVFKVLVNGETAAGIWESRDIEALADVKYYFWRWDRFPLIERKCVGTTLKSFKNIDTVFKPSNLGGARTFEVNATPHIRIKLDAEVVHRTHDDIERCWAKLPGAYLPMFLLCQSVEGMGAEELSLVADVVAPNSRVSQYLLHKYEKHGYLVLRGHRWFIRESRAEIDLLKNDTLQMNYCGDPSILWGLFRGASYALRGSPLPNIDLIDKRGEIPYLRMIWPAHLRSEIVQHMKRNQIVNGPILWNH